MRLIAVVMGENTSSERNKEVSALLDYGYNLYQKEVYLNKDEVLGTKEVEKGIDRVANIVLNEDVASINKKGYKVGELTYELDVKKIKAPIKKGEIVGSLTVKEDGKIINKVDVTVDKNIDKAGLFTMYIRHLEDIVKGNIKF